MRNFFEKTNSPPSWLGCLVILKLQEVWKTILFGYTFPTKDVDGGKIRKTIDEYNKEESRKFQLNSRVIYILVCAMD